MWSLFRKKKIEDPIRPRYGFIVSNGERRLIVFHPTNDPRLFIPKYADTQEDVVAHVGDRFSVDVIGAGQGLLFSVLTDDIEDD